jgi:hypothetical protein
MIGKNGDALCLDCAGTRQERSGAVVIGVAGNKKVRSVAIQDCNLRERRVFITVKLNVQASRAACASASGLGTRDCVGREQVKQSSTVIVERSSNQQVSCRVDMTSRLA